MSSSKDDGNTNMDCCSKNPELSIVVPVLNEAGTVQGLIHNLAEQKGVDVELIICDGGSTDGTPDRFRETSRNFPFPSRIIAAGRGRGRQMNKGVAAARGDFLLFLHADSLFDDRNALRKGLDTLASAARTVGHERLAGHFALRFRQPGDTPSLFYYYHECKAGLERRGCTHGDQGFLLHRSFFYSAGPFEESIPVLEDTRLAEAIRNQGVWLLLPSEIYTSTRRFETEGHVERETINALVMTLSAVDRNDFLVEMPRVYASQDLVGRLRLFPFFRKIRELVSPLPFRERMSFWYACGAYAVANAWQPAFLLDVRRNFRRGLAAGKGTTRCLDSFDRYFIRLLDHPPGRMAAAILVWIWFRLTGIYCRIRENGRGEARCSASP